MAAINELVEGEYKRPPRVLPFSIHIKAQSGLQVCDKRGKLQPISPIEPRHAVIKALAKRIREKAPQEELGLIATPPSLHPNSQICIHTHKICTYMSIMDVTCMRMHFTCLTCAAVGLEDRVGWVGEMHARSSSSGIL